MKVGAGKVMRLKDLSCCGAGRMLHLIGVPARDITRHPFLFLLPALCYSSTTIATTMLISSIFPPGKRMR